MEVDAGLKALAAHGEQSILGIQRATLRLELAGSAYYPAGV